VFGVRVLCETLETSQKHQKTRKPSEREEGTERGKNKREKKKLLNEPGKRIAS
jgi:hypothetical protein